MRNEARNVARIVQLTLHKRLRDFVKKQFVAFLSDEILHYMRLIFRQGENPYGASAAGLDNHAALLLNKFVTEQIFLLSVDGCLTNDLVRKRIVKETGTRNDMLHFIILRKQAGKRNHLSRIG